MIAKEGFPYILTAVLAFLLILIIPKQVLLIILFIIVAFFFWFFRDPERNIPPHEGIVVSPADGKIVEIKEEEFEGETYKKVSIFMNIFDVHVNRVPITGKVLDVVHKPGKFLAADKPESSFENEQNIIIMDTDIGKVVLKQVAGLVARRTVSYLKPGDKALIGDKLGIIKFSSRVDIYLPTNVEVVIDLNDRVLAGESVIARFSS